MVGGGTVPYGIAAVLLGLGLWPQGKPGGVPEPRATGPECCPAGSLWPPPCVSSAGFQADPGL